MAERPIVWVEYKGRWVAVVEVEEVGEVVGDNDTSASYLS